MVNKVVVTGIESLVHGPQVPQIPHLVIAEKSSKEEISNGKKILMELKIIQVPELIIDTLQGHNLADVLIAKSCKRTESTRTEVCSCSFI
ncbi:hypothetical protein F3Y22_tig00111408pilonHSYRG00061 [Hibiscus syriacus]|uniref:Uncharacterized protein n=1 Tax=Hibiscus syriacus TaxID=106335 RepID=A0A6A2XPX2_HIBSY|nr:hypothetical protein F3Y22_tig00111408pilonHSYRG00061 [Hibiscus syriacus]